MINKETQEQPRTIGSDQTLRGMSPNAQRIAIAEACGYRDGQLGFWEEDFSWTQHKNGNPTAIYIKTGLRCDLPNYLSDLNAMHEALQTIPDGEQEIEYVRNLYRTKYKFSLPVIDTVFEVRHIPLSDLFRLFESAIAAQKAEAFLRTLNLWIESQPNAVELKPARSMQNVDAQLSKSSSPTASNHAGAAPKKLVTRVNMALQCLMSDHVQNNKHRLGALGATDLHDAITFLTQIGATPCADGEGGDLGGDLG